MKALIRNTLLLLVPALSLAQVPVDDDGNVVGTYESQADITPIDDEGIARVSQDELQELVGPVALYPDELLAIVLPAAAYPLQIVEAARFLEALKSDPTLKPNPEWDDSVVALTNYPEVVELMNNDLDWTLRLGEAVVVQQAEVVAAVEAFRDRAYATGNLKSDKHQTVSNDNEVISIAPLAEDVIYVPYYEPTEVVQYQPRPVYHYYPQAYPVYYYPYAPDYNFNNGYFWGVTTAFTIGWVTDSLHVYHNSYYGHPYYGRSYYDRWWYRRPSINVYNTYYRNNNHGHRNHFRDGDRWHARNTRREYVRREGYSRSEHRSDRRSERRNAQQVIRNESRHAPLSFRQRNAGVQTQARTSHTRNARARNTRALNTRSTEPLAFRARETQREPRPARSHSLRRQEPAVRSRDTHRQQPVLHSRNTQRATPARQTRQHAPARPVRAPARQESRHSEPRQQRPVSRGSEPKHQSGHKNSESSKSSKSSGRHSSSDSSRSRSRDRRH